MPDRVLPSADAHVPGVALSLPRPVADDRPLRICVLRALQLGDLMTSVPALRSIRAGFPDAEITLLGLPWAESWVQRYRHLVDRFEALPGVPGLPEQDVQPELIPGFLRRMQRLTFDLAVQLHGSGEIVNPIVAMLGARRTAGFFTPGGYVPDAETFVPYPDRLPEVRRLLRLTEHLGLPDAGDALEFPLTTRDRAEARGILAQYGLRRGRYVVVHPGARATERRWSPTNFAEAVQRLGASGLGVVVTGSESEAPLTAEVAAAIPTAVDLAGRTSLGGLAAILAGSTLLIANDTGVSHLADALAVPSVVVFSASDPHRWAPLDRRLHRTVWLHTGAGIDSVVANAQDLLSLGTRRVA